MFLPGLQGACWIWARSVPGHSAMTAPTTPYSGTNLGRSGSASAMKRWIRASASASVSSGPIAETKRISAPSVRPTATCS